jgi:hypothetical protein
LSTLLTSNLQQKISDRQTTIFFALWQAFSLRFLSHQSNTMNLVTSRLAEEINQNQIVINSCPDQIGTFQSSQGLIPPILFLQIFFMCHPQSSILSIPFGLGLVYST